MTLVLLLVYCNYFNVLMRFFIAESFAKLRQLFHSRKYFQNFFSLLISIAAAVVYSSKASAKVGCFRETTKYFRKIFIEKYRWISHKTRLSY